MPETFHGPVRLPGELEASLTASLTVDEDQLTLTSGDDALGSWTRDACLVEPDRGGVFRLILGGEELYFIPESVSEFATALAVPLRTTRQTTDDEMDAIDKMILESRDRPTVDARRDGIVTNGFLGVVVVLALLLTAGLVAAVMVA